MCESGLRHHPRFLRQYAGSRQSSGASRGFGGGQIAPVCLRARRISKGIMLVICGVSY